MSASLTLTLRPGDGGDPFFNDHEVTQFGVEPQPDIGRVGNKLEIDVDWHGDLRPVRAIYGFTRHPAWVPQVTDVSNNGNCTVALIDDEADYVIFQFPDRRTR